MRATWLSSRTGAGAVPRADVVGMDVRDRRGADDLARWIPEDALAGGADVLDGVVRAVDDDASAECSTRSLNRRSASAMPVTFVTIASETRGR